MKLDHKHIRALRLERSWSQEKLAELTGLNPRTIQRVETDGKASLHTRTELARVFGVEPGELLHPADDLRETETRYGPGPFSSLRPHLPILLLITCFWIAWAPLFIRLSKATYSSVSLPSFPEAPSLWLLVITGCWLVFAGLWMSLAVLMKKGNVPLQAAYLLIPLVAGTLRLWFPGQVMLIMTGLLLISGSALLFTFYCPNRHSRRLRHTVLVSILTYVYIWCFHSALYSFAFAAVNLLQTGGEIHAPWIHFGTYMQRSLMSAAQAAPVMLLLFFDMGRDKHEEPGTGPRKTVTPHSFLQSFLQLSRSQ